MPPTFPGRLQHRLPDILILDLNLPDTSGVELMPDLRRRYPHLPVLVLTMHKDQLLAAKLLRAGANGYLSKDFWRRRTACCHGKGGFRC